jgi:hypothetical protein
VGVAVDAEAEAESRATTPVDVSVCFGDAVVATVLAAESERRTSAELVEHASSTTANNGERRIEITERESY